MGVKPPERFNFNEPRRWSDWREAYIMYDVLAKLEKEDPKYRVTNLLYTMGMPESKRIMDSFSLSAEDQVKFSRVVAEFDAYFKPHKNVVHERAIFHQRHQLPGETVEQYLSSLRELAINCNFSDQEDQLRDVLTVGLLDKTCSMQIQLLDKCTLQDAVTLARRHETVKANMKHQMVKAQVSEQHMQAEAQLVVDRCAAQERTQPKMMQRQRHCSSRVFVG